MDQKKWLDSLTSLLIGALASLTLLALLSLFMLWAIGRPVQAAPENPADPTPTAYIPSAGVPPATEVPPTATPVPPTAVPPTPAPPTIVANTDGVNVRSGPSVIFAVVDFLAPGAEARVLGRYADWWQIETPGAPGWVAGWVVTAYNVEHVPEVVPPPTPVVADPIVIPPPAAPGEIDEARWIDIDLSEQTLTAYEDGVVVRTTLVSTGLPATPTPTGQFRIWVKYRYDDMSGEDYYIKDVPYVMYFYRGFGLHGVTWHGNFGHPMSHGCVNLPTEEAEWLYGWADVGTLVNIHE
jgi:lipoprotein-anchoring transpeptidase ErfK/SrfK